MHPSIMLHTYEVCARQHDATKHQEGMIISSTSHVSNEILRHFLSQSAAKLDRCWNVTCITYAYLFMCIYVLSLLKLRLKFSILHAQTRMISSQYTYIHDTRMHAGQQPFMHAIICLHAYMHPVILAVKCIYMCIYTHNYVFARIYTPSST